jgi:hypothetical protein
MNINYFQIDIVLFPIYNMSSQISHHRKILMFLTGTSGIFFSYILLAIFAEQLYSAKYPSTVKFKKDGSAAEHQFVHPSIVVLLTALSCALFGLAKSRWHNRLVTPSHLSRLCSQVSSTPSTQQPLTSPFCSCLTQPK